MLLWIVLAAVVNPLTGMKTVHVVPPLLAFCDATIVEVLNRLEETKLVELLNSPVGSLIPTSGLHYLASHAAVSSIHQHQVLAYLLRRSVLHGATSVGQLSAVLDLPRWGDVQQIEIAGILVEHHPVRRSRGDSILIITLYPMLQNPPRLYLRYQGEITLAEWKRCLGRLPSARRVCSTPILGYGLSPQAWMLRQTNP